MTTMFVDVGAQAKALRSLLDTKYTNPDEAERRWAEYRERLDSFALGAACRMYRLFAERFSKVYDASRKNRPSVAWNVVVIPASEPGYVRCFPSLPFSHSDGINFGHMSRVTPLQHFGIARLFWDNLQAELADPKKAKGWETNYRAWRRVRKSETLTVQRALIKYANIYNRESGEYIPASEAPDHIIRDVGGRISDVFMPPQIKWTQTPEDYAEMYKIGGPESCMTIGEGIHHNFKFLLDEFGICPASFYYYHPYSQGVFLKERGKVQARAIVFNQPARREGERSKWYGRIYSNSGRAEDTLRKELHKHGYYSPSDAMRPEEGDAGNCIASTQFEIPVYHSKKHGGVIPVPHLDHIGVDINGKHDKERDVVVITTNCNGEDHNVNSGTNGFIPIFILSNQKCSRCNHTIRDARHAIAPQDSHDIYCCAEHAEDSGYVPALQNDGARVWAYHENCLQDAVDRSQWYTNEAAAKAQGAVPYTPSLHEIPEDAGLTCFGSIVRFKDTGHEYAVEPSYFRKFYEDNSELFTKMPGDLSMKYVFDADKMGRINLNDLKRIKVVEYDSSRPLANISGSLSWLPDNWADLMPKGYNDPAMLTFDAGICKIMQAPVEEAERHAFEFAA